MTPARPTWSATRATCSPPPGTATRSRGCELGVGLDFGTAFVGNVGAGDVKDFTAIGDVVNTAARLQAAAGRGEIVMSARVGRRVGPSVAGASERELSLKGKSEPERALVLSMDRRPGRA